MKEVVAAISKVKKALSASMFTAFIPANTAGEWNVAIVGMNDGQMCRNEAKVVRTTSGYGDSVECLDGKSLGELHGLCRCRVFKDKCNEIKV